MATLWQSRLVHGGLAVVGLGVASFCLLRQRLNRICPRVPLSSLPTSSACRNLVEQATLGTADSPKAWGLDQTRLLGSWSPRLSTAAPPDRDKSLTHWIPSFVAVQMILPASMLASNATDVDDDADALPLAKNLLAAFLSARASGPERWILDTDVPPLSFVTGHQLFGTWPEPAAFLMGLWSNVSRICIAPLAVPATAPKPVADFPSNSNVINRRDGEGPVAGSVLYWRAGQRTVQMVDRVTSLARLPWRFMEGGFQELIVERVGHGKVRVLYVSVEASTCRQGEDRHGTKWKTLPRLLYELHVMYAQTLLAGAAKRPELAA